VDLVESGGDTKKLAFINNISKLIVSKNKELNVKKLRVAFTYKWYWGKTYLLVFGLEKFQLIHIYLLVVN
jgi:hypothetical protein